MSYFRVKWEPNAENDLAREWLSATNPNAVTLAQAKADQLLARDPVANGRHVSEGLYCITVPPLKLAYTIDYLIGEVEVTWVGPSS